MIANSVSHKELPPSPFIRDFVDRLDYGPLSVLDVGCCTGRNAEYFAKLGHSVVGIDVDIDSLAAARSLSIGVSYVLADALNLPFRKKFDVVVVSELFHLLKPEDRPLAFRSIKEATNPGGFNVVSGYVGCSNNNAFAPLELRGNYSAPDWEVASYEEDFEQVIVYGGNEELTSLAKIIAVRQ